MAAAQVLIPKPGTAYNSRQDVTGQGKCLFMEGLTFSTKEQNRLQILNGVLERHWTMKEAAPLLGVGERQELPRFDRG